MGPAEGSTLEEGVGSSLVNIYVFCVACLFSFVLSHPFPLLAIIGVRVVQTAARLFNQGAALGGSPTALAVAVNLAESGVLRLRQSQCGGTGAGRRAS